MASVSWVWRDGFGDNNTWCPKGTALSSGLGNRPHEVSIVLPWQPRAHCTCIEQRGKLTLAHATMVPPSPFRCTVLASRLSSKPAGVGKAKLVKIHSERREIMGQSNSDSWAALGILGVGLSVGIRFCADISSIRTEVVTYPPPSVPSLAGAHTPWMLGFYLYFVNLLYILKRCLS